MKKIKRHILIPSLLLIYLALMTSIFGPDLLRSGEYLRFYVCCHFVLKKRYRDR